MDRLKADVTKSLRENFPAHAFSAKNLTVIHRGRFANAILLRYRNSDFDMVIKDYSHCPPVIRQLVGRFFITSETKALSHSRVFEA